MIPLAVPDLTGRESEYLQECIQTNFVSSVGPFVGAFEDALCDSTSAECAVAVSSGTAALMLALVAAGVVPGDLVIVPTYSFVASANSVRHCGAYPWFHDVTEETWTLDYTQVRRSLERDCSMEDGVLVHRESQSRVAAMMPVFTAGHPADMDPLSDLAAEFGIPLIVDGAAALGATYRGRPLGHLAKLTALSFNGNKTVTCGGGGAVLASDEVLARRVQHLATTARCGPGYRHDAVGFNLRLTNVQAAIGLAQVERSHVFVEAKRRIAARYAESFVDIGAPFPHASWADSSDWMSGIVLPGKASRVAEQLQSRGVDAREFWIPLHMQKPYLSSLRTQTPVADHIWPRVLTLPCSSSLTDEEQMTVIEAAQEECR